MAIRPLMPLFALTIIVAVTANGIQSAEADQLKFGFYDDICPRAVPLIRKIVRKAIQEDPRMGASLLRLHFHDCFVDGCDASILLDGTNNEKDARPNKDSVRGYEVIDKIKSALNDACDNVVSCADILAVAARDSVDLLGGPFYYTMLGRRDRAVAPDAGRTSSLPSPNAPKPDLLSKFQNQNLDLKDLVALSGAHSLGFARCSTAKSRIEDGADIDPQFAANVQKWCQAPTWADTILVRFDDTPYKFDNVYYKNLMRKKGLLKSDQELYKGDGSESDQLVLLYSKNRNSFFEDFAEAMQKMGNIGVLTGDQGEIRRNCRVINYRPNN